MFYALGVAGLILLTGTDLSIGRMVGMGMTASTIIMHQGINTGSVFGVVFDFTSTPLVLRALLCPRRLHLPDDSVHDHRWLLHGALQDAPVHLRDGATCSSSLAL